MLISRCGQTANCGHGLRATRSFMPNQIIVEYTGEIITQEESERRMVEVYKDNKVCCLSIIYTHSRYLLDQNYYLMLFHQNMILDATRGSVARFVNREYDSCWLKERLRITTGLAKKTCLELMFRFGSIFFVKPEP